MTETVSLKQIRGILAGKDRPPLSEMAISKYVADGMPKVARGRFDALACAIWYIDRLRNSNQKRASEGEDGKQVSLDEAERRFKMAKAEGEEMTLAERRGETIPLYVYESDLTHLVTITKQRMMNIPARLAPKLHDCSTIEIKALLNASIRDALAELSRRGKPTGPSATTSAEKKHRAVKK